jgi:hypothetical protein
MKTEDTIREHFKYLRGARYAATADYHCNVLYGYLKALRDTGQIETSLYLRMNHAVTKAWTLKTKFTVRTAA